MIGSVPESTSANLSLVALGICTFRRPILSRTLESLASQTIAARGNYCIIVADNDDSPSARPLVDKAADAQAAPIYYVHAPSRNISIARNALLERAAELGAEYLAMIDDDEVASPNWASTLVAEITRSGADAIQGPVLAQYRAEAPGWMRAARLHDVRPVIQPDGQIRTGYAGNVILRLQSTPLRTRRFDLSYGRTGGEDDAFFTGLVRDGGKIGYAPEAIAYEDVPPGREKIGFLIRRNFRAGQTHGKINAPDNRAGRALLFTSAAAKAVALAVSTGLSVFSPARRTRQIMRASLHAGVCSQILGGKILELYKS